MKHIKIDGTNNHVIIALHGSRSTLKSLFDKVESIDPKATKIGFQGKVHERGATRYFSRYSEGDYDLESLAKATSNFNDSIHHVIDKYDLGDYVITVVGYSNGANLVENFLKEFNDLPFSNVILLHPVSITPDKEFKSHNNLNLLLTSGQNDSFLSPKKFKHLEKIIKEASINLESFVHEGGHELISEEFEIAKEFILNHNELKDK